MSEREFGELIETEDGSFTVRHKGHGQDFHSKEGARFEARELYVNASGIKQAFESSEEIKVLDVGMGLGYNACVTIAEWLSSPGQASVRIVSLEIDPTLVHAVASADAPWFTGWSEAWLMGPRHLKKTSSLTYEARLLHPLTGKNLYWQILLDDGVKSVLQLDQDMFDYVWQDPFTPELNPSMWSKEWFEKVKRVSKVGAVLMTYSVARVVKDTLTQTGWSVHKIATPGRKRHWLKAIKNSRQ